MPRFLLLLSCLLACGSFPCLALGQAEKTEPTVGWRGNWTGLYPDAKTPTQWHRISKGILARVRVQADLPRGKDAGAAVPLALGLIPHWLTVGPFPVKNS